MNLDRLRAIAYAYEQAVRHNASEEGRDLEQEALAAIYGAAKCLPRPSRVDRITDLVAEVLEAAELDR